MSNADMTIANTVKRIVKRSELKQKVIAERCGYTEKQFSSVINGRKLITAEDIVKLCNGLGITPNELYGFEETA